MGTFAGVDSRGQGRLCHHNVIGIREPDASDQTSVGFLLASVTPPFAAERNHTLTIAVDSACSGLPDERASARIKPELTKRTGATIPAYSLSGGSVSQLRSPRIHTSPLPASPATTLLISTKARGLNHRTDRPEGPIFRTSARPEHRSLLVLQR